MTSFQSTGVLSKAYVAAAILHPITHANNGEPLRRPAASTGIPAEFDADDALQ
jgi:hypothetical protein